MKKSIALLLTFIICIAQLVSCDYSGNNRKRSYFYIKSAWQMNDDGWVFVFKFENPYDKNADTSDLYPYSFMGINLRYRYNDNYIQTFERESKDGGTFIQRVLPSCLMFGDGSGEQKRDMEKIARIIQYQRNVRDLLAENPDDYEFEALDKEMFFRLMRECLTSEIPEDKQDITYWDKYSWALMAEPMYVDGYKFQIGYINTMGYVDIVYIDVLYETGNGYKDYVQLSDMTENGSADEGQTEAFELIKQIAADCMEQETYIADADSYKEKTVGGIDFGRLYQFLYNIHINNDAQYIVNPIIEIEERSER